MIIDTFLDDRFDHEQLTNELSSVGFTTAPEYDEPFVELDQEHLSAFEEIDNHMTCNLLSPKQKANSDWTTTEPIHGPETEVRSCRKSDTGYGMCSGRLRYIPKKRESGLVDFKRDENGNWELSKDGGVMLMAAEETKVVSSRKVDGKYPIGSTVWTGDRKTSSLDRILVPKWGTQPCAISLKHKANESPVTKPEYGFPVGHVQDDKTDLSQNDPLGTLLRMYVNQ